jgi:hypothetical protein
VSVVLGGNTALTGGVGIGGPHRGVDGVDDSLPRPAVPVAHARGQRLVKPGNQLVVGDQIGAADDQSHGAPIGPPFGQQRRNLGQPGVQRLGIRHPVAGRHGRQVHRGGHLGRGLLEPADLRIAALVLGPLGRGYSMPQQCRHRCQPPG